MGQDPDETLREIAAIRERIDGELDALGEALPPTDEIVQKLVIGLAAGVITVLGVWYIAHRISRALRAGTVWVNCYDDDDITVPFGGYRQSGIGRDKSLHAIEKYTQLKTTWISTA